MDLNWPKLKQQHLHFVTGKGGVGKSTLALVLARRFAAEGHRTLLVEMNPHSYFSRILGVPVGHDPRQVEPRLDVANWRADECLREYVLHYLRLEKLFDIFFRNKVMRAFIEIAPGLVEISLLGKITSGIRKIGPQLNYDKIVVDCFASGDALAFFRAPQGLSTAVQVGPMGEQSRAIDQVLRDPQVSAYWVVTAYEELPAIETVELIRGIENDMGAKPRLLANRVIPGLLKPDFQNTDPLAVFVSEILGQMQSQSHWKEYLKSSGYLADYEFLFVYKSQTSEVVAELQKGFSK